MDKLDALKKYFADLQNVVIAFSGGVDSTFLLKPRMMLWAIG